MASKKNETEDRNARERSDRVELTNDSGEVKYLTSAQWEEQRGMLEAEGWKEIGADQ